MKKLIVFSLTCLYIVATLSGCTSPQPSVNVVVTPTTIVSTAPAPATTTPAPTFTPIPPTATIVLPTATPAATPTAVPVTAVLAPEILSAGDPYAPELGNKGYDVQRYTLRLALDPQVIRIDGNVTLDAVSTFDNLKQVALDFVGFEIGQVTVGKLPVSFFRQNKKLIVNLPQPLSSGATFTLNINYKGNPVQERSDYVPFVPSLGLQFHEDNAYVVSEPDGARYWFPCNDHPRDKATYRFEIVVPDGYVGVANGKLINTQKGIAQAFSDGRPGDLYIWEHNFPMASYLATVAVGKYVRVESTSPKGIRLRSYVFPEKRVEFELLSPTLGEAIDWMSDVFGPYPFEEFGYVMVKQLNASLETQTMVVLDQDSKQRTLIHEMSHMWFGDWVTPDTWRDVWRNEGFATYAALWFPARNNPAALDQQVVQSMKNQKPVQYGLTNPPRDQLFGSFIYVKGSAVFNALRKEIGDQAFVDGLRMYLKQYGGRTATEDEFETTMEKTAGKSLKGLFVEWLK